MTSDLIGPSSSQMMLPREAQMSAETTRLAPHLPFPVTAEFTSLDLVSQRAWRHPLENGGEKNADRGAALRFP